jgi:hypothetical protein
MQRARSVNARCPVEESELIPDVLLSVPAEALFEVNKAKLSSITKTAQSASSICLDDL